MVANNFKILTINFFSEIMNSLKEICEHLHFWKKANKTFVVWTLGAGLGWCMESRAENTDIWELQHHQPPVYLPGTQVNASQRLPFLKARNYIVPSLWTLSEVTLLTLLNAFVILVNPFFLGKGWDPAFESADPLVLYVERRDLVSELWFPYIPVYYSSCYLYSAYGKARFNFWTLTLWAWWNPILLVPFVGKMQLLNSDFWRVLAKFCH